MALVELAPLEGRMRARLEEDQWAGVVSGLGLDLPEGCAPLGTVVPAGCDAGRGLAAAARLLATAPVRVELLAHRVDAPAVLASVVTDGWVAASLVRAVVPGTATTPGPAGDHRLAGLVPGVEVSAYRVGAVVPELLRLVPPVRSTWTVADHTVTVPLEVGLAVHDLLDPGVVGPGVVDPHDPRVDPRLDPRLDQRLPRLLAAAGLPPTDPPTVLASLDRVTADLALTVQHPSGRRRLLRLLAGRRGWVELTTDGDQVTHRPLDQEALGMLLTHELAGAVHSLLDVPGGGAR